MPGALRKTDMSQGHGCFPPRPNMEGSSTVMIDNLPAHRKGDKWLIHICMQQSHDGVLMEGSTIVMVDNKPLGRIGDSISCGDKAKTGSNDVMVG